MSRPRRLDPSIARYVSDPVIARTYDRTFAYNPLFASDAAFVDAHVRPGARVLDLGAGTGRHVVQLARRGCRVVGLDLSAHMLALARDKLAEEGLRAALVQADMLRLPFAPGPRFDAILLMFSTLGLVHGAAAREALVAWAARLLAPGGVLLVHVHNQDYVRSAHRTVSARATEKVGQMLGLLEPGDHIVRNYRGRVDLRLHSFTREELVDLLDGAGLRVRELVGLNDRRDGPCTHADVDRFANGFLVAAQCK